MKHTFPILFFLFMSCFMFDEEEPNNKQDTNLTLSIHSVGVTSVNLFVTPDDTLATYSFEIDRNDSTVLSLHQISDDTLINDGGLEPNTSYTYTLNRVLANTRTPLDSLTATTMDTTSVDFTFWIFDTFGVGGSEVKDVHIVNEDDIYIVGRFIMEDSADFLPGGYTYYNVGHWDGNKWTFTEAVSASLPLTSITYFNENDIWATHISFPFHWDGNEWTYYHLQDMIDTLVSVSTCWGTSSSNMYFAGSEYRSYGHIVYYDGTNFSLYVTDIKTHLTDIAGSPDGEHILIIGKPNYLGQEWSLFYSNGNPMEWERIEVPDGLDNFYGMDVYGDTAYIPMSTEIWKYNYLTGESIIQDLPTSEQPWISTAFVGVKVLQPNNQLYTDMNFKILHYNGLNYNYNTDNDGGFASYNSDYNGNIIVLVGSAGFVARGFKQ